VEIFGGQAREAGSDLKSATDHLVDIFCSEDTRHRRNAGILLLDVFKSNITPLTQEVSSPFLITCAQYFEKILECDFEDDRKLAKTQGLLIATLLENAVRSTQNLSESEAMQQMLEMVLDKLTEDSETNIHLALRILYNLLLRFEEHFKDQEYAK
jgi:hypothetical protein